MSADDVLAAIDGAVFDWESDSPDAMRWVPPEAREQLKHLREGDDDVEPMWDGYPDTAMLFPPATHDRVIAAFMMPIGGSPAGMIEIPVDAFELQEDGSYVNREPISFTVFRSFAAAAGELAGSFELDGQVAREVEQRLSDQLMELFNSRAPQPDLLIPPRSHHSSRPAQDMMARDIAHALGVPPEVVGILPCPSDGVCECTSFHLHHEQSLSAAERALEARRSRNTGPPRPPASRQRRPRTHH